MSRDESTDAPVKAPRGTAPRRWQFSLGRLMILTAVVAIHLAAIAMIVANLEGPIAHNGRVYAMVMPPIMLVTLVLLNLLFKWHYGRILVQLESRQSAAWYTSWALVPALCLVVIPLLPFTLRGIVAIGLLGGLAPSLANSCLAMLDQSVQFRERGVFVGLWRRKWTRFPPIAWRIDTTGILTLGKRWWGIKAIVPPDERAAVEALLERKLGRMSDV